MGQQLCMGTDKDADNGTELPTGEAEAVWQPQLMAVPKPQPAAGTPPAYARVGDTYRQLGLLGVAQARAALADAARRAEERDLNRAA